MRSAPNININHKALAESTYSNNTLPETDIVPENSLAQKESSLPTIQFQGREMLVSGSVPLGVNDRNHGYEQNANLTTWSRQVLTRWAQKTVITGVTTYNSYM